MRPGRQLISRAERTPLGAPGAKLEPFPVNVRVKISALWASMLFVFVYVDLFSLYRPDFRADIGGWRDRRVRHQPDLPFGDNCLCRDSQA